MNGTMRMPTRTRYGTLAFGFALSLLLATRPGHADTPASLPARLEIIWSTPITTEITAQGGFGRSEGLVLDAAAVAPDGTVMLLGAMIGGQRPGRALLRDAEKAAPDAAAFLELPAPDPSSAQSIWTWFVNKRKPSRNPVILSLALGAEGGTWLGGFSDSHDSYMGFTWGRSSRRLSCEAGRGGNPALEAQLRRGRVTLRREHRTSHHRRCGWGRPWPEQVIVAGEGRS